MKFLRRLFTFLLPWRKRSSGKSALEQNGSAVHSDVYQERKLEALTSSGVGPDALSTEGQSDLAVVKAEQSFDIVSAQVTKLANVGQGLAKHSRRLAMFSSVSALWLWFYSFRGIIANWSWLTNISLVLLVAFLVPSVLVFCLYFVLRQSINLPKSFMDLKDDILNGDDGVLNLFAQKSTKHSLLASWKVFAVIRNFRELLQSFPTLFSQYKSVLTLSNPLLAALLGGSVFACVLINTLAIFTFVIWLMGRF